MKVSKISIITKSAIIFLLIINGFVSAQSNDIRNADPIGFPNINKKSQPDGNKIQKIYGIGLNSNSTISRISTNPIYIVNGKRIENLNAINADKIKSITVYKDKKATEIYGEEAKNGVIVIEAEKDYQLKVQPKDPNRPEILAI